MIQNELKHYGVKGMKWGRRRSSNQPTKNSIRKERLKAKKNLHTMSDDELKRRLNRLNMESQYKKQVRSIPQQTVDKGKKFAMGAALATTTAITLYSNADKISKIVNSKINK